MVGKQAEAVPPDLAECAGFRDGYAEPIAGAERILSGVLADVMHVEHVSADSHFFNELGADSLVMAHFCARVRMLADLPPVSL